LNDRLTYHFFIIVKIFIKKLLLLCYNANGVGMENKKKKQSKEELSVAEKVELSLQKRFHKELFSRFCRAINEYDLIKPNDNIAVCISGGKDSMLMAKLFQELKKHNKFPFEVNLCAYISDVTSPVCNKFPSSVKYCFL